MAFAAQHAGTCPACGARFSERTRIMWRTDTDGDNPGWGHEVCPDPLAVEHVPCSRCFLVHPPGTCDR